MDLTTLPLPPEIWAATPDAAQALLQGGILCTPGGVLQPERRQPLYEEC